MGEAIARLFSQEGARLSLFDLNADVLGTIAKETGQLSFAGDVTIEADVRSYIRETAQALGGIDGLVNSAGILLTKPLVETAWNEFQKIVSVNLGGPFLTCREALPFLQQSGHGTIVNIASLAGIHPMPSMSVYSATKAGLVALTEALSGEAGPHVRVNAICPGIIRTPMTRFMWDQDEEAGNANVRALVQLGRAGEPSEIAEAALYLSSDLASFVSGARLTVSGGHFH